MKRRVSEISIKYDMIQKIIFFVLTPLFLSLIILSFLLQNNMISGTRESYRLMFEQKAQRINDVIEQTNYASSTLITYGDVINLLSTYYNDPSQYARSQAQSQLVKSLQRIRISQFGNSGSELVIVTQDGKMINSYEAIDIDGSLYTDSAWAAKIRACVPYPYWDREINEVFGSGSINSYYTFGRNIQRYEGRSWGLAVVRIPKAIFSVQNIDSPFCTGEIIMLSPEREILTDFDYEGKGVSRAAVDEIMSQAEAQELKSNEVAIGRCDYLYYMYTRMDSNNNSLLYIGDYQTIFAQSSRIMGSIIFLMAVATLIMILAVIRISDSITKPVDRLVNNMQFIENDRPLTHSGHRFTELKKLEDSFIHAQERIQVLLGDVIKQTQQKEKAYYEALQAQINPHFLFNTLNAIRWKAALKHEDELAEVLQELSVLVNETYNNTEELETLQNAIAILESYVKIMRVRFGNKVSFLCSSPNDLLDCLIPRFCLQPLVENSFLHGMANMEEGLILLRAEQENNDLLLVLTDNGRGIEKDNLQRIALNKQENERRHKVTGIGLPNIQQRIKSVFGEGYGLELDTDVKIGFRITLRLPIQRRQPPSDSPP